jgi:hypothetical protein
MPGDRNLLSLDASLAIPTRVLRFEDFGLRRRTPIRPVLLTGQTGTHRLDRRPTSQTGQTHRSDWSGTAASPSSVLRSWLCGSTKEPSGFLVNHRKPRELGVASANPTHDSAPTKSRLDLGFEAQPRNRPRLHVAVHATMWPALDPAGHRVPRTKPTCFLHT